MEFSRYSIELNERMFDEWFGSIQFASFWSLIFRVAITRPVSNPGELVAGREKFQQKLKSLNPFFRISLKSTIR